MDKGQMTRHVATTELKGRLSEILGDVERGETIAVTRHGKTIARIVPDTVPDREKVRQAVEQMRALRASLPKAGVTVDDIIEWRDEGRRY